jgi:hypothetical protein
MVAASLGTHLAIAAGTWTRTPASGQASAPLTHPEETAGRLIRRRSAGSGNCDQARLAVTDDAMVPSRRVVLARARPAARQPSATRVQHGLTRRPHRHQGRPGSRRHQRAGRHRHPHPRRAGRTVRAAIRRARAAALARGAFISARIFRAASALASVRMRPRPSSSSRSQTTPGTVSTTPVPVTGAQPAGLTRSSPRTRWCTAERCCTPSDRHSASATALGPPTGRRETRLVPATSSPRCSASTSGCPAPAIRAPGEPTPASSTGLGRRAKPTAARSAPKRGHPTAEAF